MGLSINSPDCNNVAKSHYHTHKIFLLSNYILLGAASSCIFLLLSLRLVPSVSGFLLILLHVLTIAGAVSGCSAASGGSNKWYALHMVATVLTAIFQGSVSVLIFTTTSNFLGALKSYVREDDAAVILKLAGGLSIAIFCLEWLVLVMAFVLRYYGFVEGNNGSRAQGGGENRGKWASPFQPFQV
ncbi:unnamed protein product [Coffea canephora]|uniref:Uncharacterized protein n=2 Tax=Coffea TaxID=13442 RepID=A0A068UI79_COFCA|nr:uncharacterized protein LOC113735082 [Coffea arabica]CDP08002.1 unnamed protein product [Coffea canephora]